MIAAPERPSLAEDFAAFLRAARIGDPSLSGARALALDGFVILVLFRIRQWVRRFHIPLLNTILRRTQMMFFGIELGNEVQLGAGVYFVHSLGTVIGGTSRVGSGVRFLGNNTLGTAKENGYPVLEDDVLVGCGARILGPVRVGARAVIGANAVVLSDVPADAVAVGIPAKIKLQSTPSDGPSQEEAAAGG